MSDAPPGATTRRATGRFGGLGAISSRMAIIQHSQVHVNGAYRERPDAVARVRT